MEEVSEKIFRFLCGGRIVISHNLDLAVAVCQELDREYTEVEYEIIIREPLIQIKHVRTN
jgi:hypothetical protein